MKTSYIIKKISLLVLISLVTVNKLSAQVSITSLPYNPGTTTFDSFNPGNLSNALATIPAGWSFSSTGTPAYNGQSVSGSTAGGYWSYTYFLSGDYNLGGLRNSTVGNITYHVDFVNNSGGPVTDLVLSWDYEQWIFANSSGWSCFGTGALAGNSILNTKGYIGSSSSFLNQATSTPLATFTLTGLNIANGASFGISWITNDDTGADNGVAIDNFSMSASAMPSITIANGAVAAANIYQNSVNNVLYRTDISTTPIAAVLNSAAFTTAGTYAAANLTNLKLWYSASSVFSAASATLLGTKTTTLGAGVKTFTGLTQSIPVGTGYLFLTTDLPCNTTAGNNISVSAISLPSFTFASGSKSGSGFTAGGLQTIAPITVNAVSSQSICSGKSMPAVTFVTLPAGQTVTWDNNNTSIGIAASGTGNITSYITPVLGSNQTGVITATASSGACIGTNTSFSITVKSNGQSSTSWTGLISSDWTDADNWTNCVCNSVSNVTITNTGNSPQIGTTANVKNLTINSGASLSIQNTQFLNLYGNWINNGSFDAQQSSVALAGSIPQTIGGSAFTSFYDVILNNSTGVTLSSGQQIKGNLQLNSGTFDTNNFLTLAADATGSGRIGRIYPSADIINKVTVQQYAPGGSTGWALLGSPLSSALTMADWNDNFAISCLTCPNGYSNFTSIYSYSESIAGSYSAAVKYIPIANITDNITPGKGYWVYLGNGAYNTTGINFDVTGTVAKSSCLTCGAAVTIPVSYTSNNGIADDGWNLVTNPLPSPISWTALRNGNTKVDNALYVYNADLNGGLGAHTSYVNGVSSDVTNNLTDNIAMCQGFYIHATAATTLTAGENIKTNTAPGFLRPNQNPISSKPIFRLVLNEASGMSDMTTFYFEQGGSTSFQTDFDAYKLNYDPSTIPYIGSMSDSVLTGISGLPELTSNLTIPVKAITPASSSFTISALKSDFPDNVCVTLYDAFTGISTNILTSSYTCTLYDTTTTTRFKISFYSTPLAGSSLLSQPSCAGPNNGYIIAMGNNSGPWNYEWKNGSTVVKTSSNKTTADSLTTLNGGNYTVRISTAGQCDNFSQTFTVNTIVPSTAAFVPDVFTAYMSNQGRVNFTNSSSNAQVNSWYFGDNSGTSALAGPFYNYNAAGIYTITLVTQSSTFCKDTAQQVVEIVDDATGISTLKTSDQMLLCTMAPGQYNLKLLFNSGTNVEMTLCDIKGNSLNTVALQGVSKTDYPVDLSSLASGMYLLKVTTNNSTVKIFKLVK